MRRRILIPLLLSMLPLCGCGDRSLIMTVDILSFMDPGSRASSYGPIIGPLPVDTVTVVSDTLNLLQGIGDVTTVTSASLKIGASFNNTSGAASGHFLIYIAPADSGDAFSAPPLADIPVVLSSGTITNVSTQIDSSPTLAAALTRDKAQLGIRLVLNGIVGVLQGTETLTELKATVIAQKSL